MTLIYTPPKRIIIAKANQSSDDQNEQMLAAILAYLASEEPSLMRELRKLWNGQRDLITIRDIERQLSHGTLTADWYGDWYTSYQQFIDKVLMDMWLDAMRNAARNQLSRHPAFSFDTTTSGVLDWLNARMYDLSDMLARTQTNGMQRAIESAVQREMAGSDIASLLHAMIGLTPRQAMAVERYYDTLRAEGMDADKALAKAQRYINKSLKARSLNISRTELANAFNEGSVLAIQQAQAMGLVGNVTKTWVTQHDERVCPICGALDDVTVDQHEMFPGGYEHPGAHVNCLVGDTPVLSRSPILAASKRWFDGNVVVIQTASGLNLTATPNHPILTRNGWIVAGALNVGDNVICDGGSEWMSSAVNVKDKDIPTRIEDIAEAFLGSEEVTSCPVPVSPEDFHGDGGGSEVAIIGANSLLLNEIQSTLMKHDSQLLLDSGGTETLSLNSQGYFAPLIERSLAILGSDVRRSDLSDALLIRHPRPFDRFGFGLTTDRNSVLLEPALNDASVNSVSFGQGENGLSTLIESNEVINRQLDALARDEHRSNVSEADSYVSEMGMDCGHRDFEDVCNILEGMSIPIFTDHIVGVDIIPFHGYVYNLQTEKGFYTANGIITHNCRCVLVYKEVKSVA